MSSLFPGNLAQSCHKLSVRLVSIQDKWFVTINEAIARKLQEEKIVLLSQALEEKGVIGLGVGGHE